MNASPAPLADRKRHPAKFEVARTEWVTPRMQRIVLGGAGFAAFAERHRGFTDSYVKIQFLRPGVTYPDPLDMQVVRDTMPAEDRPVPRTYTVRWIDHDAAQLAIDFVVHDDEGIAGPWAANVRPGDTVHVAGPGGAYSPSPEADWHLLAGDEAALPAISTALEAMPAGVPAHAYIEVADADEEQKLETSADLHLTWLHRDGAPAGSTTLIADAVKAFDWPTDPAHGRAQAFVHGEAGLLKALRSYLLTDRGVEREMFSMSGYWRRGTNDEGFRVWKAEQKGA